MMTSRGSCADLPRNKYNTLTLAEAKKLNRSLASGSVNMSQLSQSQNHNPYLYSTIRRTPLRTASVMYKPRAPPIVVTDLDTTIDQLDGASLGDSYSSAYSNVSSSTLRPASATPNKSGANNKSAARSVSKMSLSGSTYRVFHSPIANLKKFLRNMPRPFSANSELESHFDVETTKPPSYLGDKSSHLSDQSLGDRPICNSISQISLNKSQSPPVCPPPPSQLKSMCYMESAMNYSNYDEFTRSRNQRLAQRQQSISSALNGQQSEDRHSLNSDQSEYWQLTSLPVYYERNLTTLFEEKQKNSEMVMSKNGTSDRDSLGVVPHKSMERDNQQQQQQQYLIRPPIHFDDNGHTRLTSEDIKQQQQQLSTGSMQSLNSCLTTASAVRPQAPATPYRFSFAQPLKQADEASCCLVDHVSFQKNIALPPRVPTDLRLSINTSELSASTRQDNSSSGNSSNCSSQLNGMNNCDKPNSADANSADKLSFNSNEYSTSTRATNANNCAAYGNLEGLADNETDLTLLSDTSTLQGDTGIAYYANKCAELERTVASLKNKLVSKEKELTDLQLNQLNNDYTIERLKKLVARLERENGQLKTILSSKN